MHIGICWQSGFMHIYKWFQLIMIDKMKGFIIHFVYDMVLSVWKGRESKGD